MDAGLIGGLIGVGIMGCGILTALCYNQGETLHRRWQRYRQVRTPLLPVVVVNPVRRNPRQWKMKQLLASK